MALSARQLVGSKIFDSTAGSRRYRQKAHAGCCDMTGAELLALDHAAMARSHSLILLGGGLGLLSIVAGLISRRIGAPVLLVFLAIGMLAGDDHVLGVPFDDFGAVYLIGSVALAVILLEGGLKTPVSMLRLAFWPAAVLATIGVGVTAGILGAVVSLIDGVPVTAALLCRCGGSTHRCCRGRGVAAPCGCCTAGTALRAAQGRIRAQ